MSCANAIKVVKGTSESISFSLIVDNVKVTDLTDWTCKIQLRLNDTAQTLIFEKDVTELNGAADEFVVLLLPADTNIDISDNYILGVEFNNAVTSENEESYVSFNITKSWVF